MPAERTVTRNGQTYTMNTANIGQRKPAPELELPLAAGTPSGNSYHITEPPGQGTPAWLCDRSEDGRQHPPLTIQIG